MRILHVTYCFNGGGVGFVIANYCTRPELKEISFDIVGEDIGKKHLLHDRFEADGFGVHYVTPKGKNLLRNISQMFRLMKKGHYDGVHVHFEEWSFLYLMIAWLCGIKLRVCHAHMAYMPGTDTKLHYRLFRVLLNYFATERLACSKDAGKHLYGKHPYKILNNAIEAQQYRYDPVIREKVRKSLGMEDKLVIGVVGRLSFQKNPQMSLEILREIRRIRQDAVMLMIGTGELEDEVKKQIREYDLYDVVRLMGLRQDVPELLQAMDVFVLPSRFEGLGIVYVEAQAAGLYAFGTEGVVPEEVAVCPNLMKFIPKEHTAEQWAKAVLDILPYEREITTHRIAEAGYDLSSEVQKLAGIYGMEGQRKQ